jgi:negative regulator of flagellin synthesis FlgM
MNTINTRAPFFPNSKNAAQQSEIERSNAAQMRRNSYERAQELSDRTARDVNVNIPDSIKDYSRIKRVVDTAPPIDNTEKIAQLKAQIQAGTYQPDYDAVADKMLRTEF